MDLEKEVNLQEEIGMMRVVTRWLLKMARGGEESAAYFHNILNWIESGPQRWEAALVMASTIWRMSLILA